MKVRAVVATAASVLALAASPAAAYAGPGRGPVIVVDDRTGGAWPVATAAHRAAARTHSRIALGACDAGREHPIGDCVMVWVSDAGGVRVLLGRPAVIGVPVAPPRQRVAVGLLQPAMERTLVYLRSSVGYR